MSRAATRDLGLTPDEAAALGSASATRIRTFRLIVVVSQELRTLMDDLLRPDGLTTQQAALTTVIEVLDRPSITQAAEALGTSHQNLKQLAAALERKGLLTISADPADGRAKRLATTAKSRAIWRRRSAVDQQRVLEWFSILNSDEANTLYELLLKLQDHLLAVSHSGAETND